MSVRFAWEKKNDPHERMFAYKSMLHPDRPWTRVQQLFVAIYVGLPLLAFLLYPLSGLGGSSGGGGASPRRRSWSFRRAVRGAWRYVSTHVQGLVILTNHFWAQLALLRELPARHDSAEHSTAIARILIVVT